MGVFQYHRKSVGKALVDAAESLARSKGAKFLTVRNTFTDSSEYKY